MSLVNKFFAYNSNFEFIVVACYGCCKFAVALEFTKNMMHEMETSGAGFGFDQVFGVANGYKTTSPRSWAMPIQRSTLIL